MSNKHQKRAHNILSEIDEKLIEYVRKNDALYDLSHRRYSDNQYKANVWVSIGEKLQLVTTENPSVSTINDEDTEYDTQLTDPQVSQDSEASYTPNASQILIISQDETLLRDSQSNLQVTVPQNKKEKTPKRAKSNVKVSTQAHTAGGTLMKYLLEEEKTKKAEIKDELDFFFESIKATVKIFSPADKHLVKSKIFGIVSDIEVKYIHQQQNIQNFPVYQASNSQVPLTIESPSTSTFHSSNHSSPTSIPSRLRITHHNSYVSVHFKLITCDTTINKKKLEN
ncbi:hypothetical protein FQA39_LY16061 [Lamprigera yunnana]|nr:hypothetical protein FQA39_LY16061 [Lamprigera yunnana]